MKNPFAGLVEAIDRVMTPKEETAQEVQRATSPLVAEQPIEGSGVDAVLAQRGSRYGAFTENSRIQCDLMGTFRNTPAWQEGRIEMHHEHALSLIATKLARLLSGDPNYDDNWTDIAGYATLMAKICRGDAS